MSDTIKRDETQGWVQEVVRATRPKSKAPDPGSEGREAEEGASGLSSERVHELMNTPGYRFTPSMETLRRISRATNVKLPDDKADPF